MLNIMAMLAKKTARLLVLLYLIVATLSTFIFYTDGLYLAIAAMWLPLFIAMAFYVSKGFIKKFVKSFVGIVVALWAIGIVEILFVGEFYLPVAWRLIVVVAVVKVVYDFISELIKAKKRFDSKFDSIRASSEGNINAEGDEFEPSWYDDEDMVHGDLTAHVTTHDFSGLNGFKYF